MEDTITPLPRPVWIAGTPEQGAETLTVSHPFDGNEVATVSVPAREQTDRAVDGAVRAAAELRRVPAHTRASALERVADGLSARGEELAEVITAENGKPLHWAQVELQRSIGVFRLAAERARQSREHSRSPHPATSDNGDLVLTRRVPRGPVLGITPFGFPLSLVAHKVAPALAVGAPIITKPAPRTPLSALILGEILAGTELPAGSFSILPLGADATSELVADPRLPVVSFTGSEAAGFSIADSAPRKHVTLETGGNAAAVVLDDWNEPEKAARRIATSGNYQAGQSCDAVQRVLVQRAIAGEFLDQLTEAVRAQPTGDPYDTEVSVGPVADEETAEHIVSAVATAVESGATLLTGGSREGTTVEPTLLADVPQDTAVWSEEMFGPVLAVRRIDSVEEALTGTPGSPPGPRTGVFTNDMRVAFRASAEPDLGGVVIGDVPSYGAEAAPHDGAATPEATAGDVSAAMREFTEEHVTVLRAPG